MYSNDYAVLIRGLGSIKADQRLVPALLVRPGQTVSTTRCCLALAQGEFARPGHAGPSFLISPYTKRNSQTSAVMLRVDKKK